MRIVRPMSPCGVLPVGPLATVLSTRYGAKQWLTGRNENAEYADHAGKRSGTQSTDRGGSPAGSGFVAIMPN